MKILLSGVKEHRREFHFTEPVRLEDLGDRAGEGEVELRVSVEPAGQRWTVRGELEGRFPFRCDRCDRPFTGRLTGDFQLLVLAAATAELDPEASEEVVVLPPGSQELDLREAVLEALWLDLPIQLSCETAGGGPCPGPPGETAAGSEAAAEGDPRWGPLAELKRRLEAEREGAAGSGDDTGKD